MAEEGNEGAPRTYTEDEYKAGIAAAVKSRLAKFSDYDDLKAKAGLLDEQQKAAAELQARVDELESRLAGYEAADERRKLLAKVAEKTGVGIDKLEALNGEDEGTLVKQAETLFPRYEPSREGQPSGAAADSGEREMVRALFGMD